VPNEIKKRDQERVETQIYVVQQYAYEESAAILLFNDLGLQHNIFIGKP
jgi:hypothetical protein